MNGEEMEELKEGWRRVRLGDVIDFNPKETLKKNTMSKYVEMAQLQCFARNIIGYSFKEYKGGTKFRNGDTLLARITPCLENGKTAFVDILEEDEVGFGSTEYIVLRKKEGYTDENYIFYLAISDLFRQIAIKSMTGTSGRQRVQTEVLKNSEIVIPEVNIQKKIASILSLLDEKIELNRKINQNLEEAAQTLFKRWFIDFEFPNEEGKPYKSSGGKMIESELGEIPEGWRVGKLGEIIEINPKENLKKLEKKIYIEMKCLSETSSIISEYYEREFTGTGTKFKNKDTLMARITPCLENGKIGYVNFLKDNDIGWGSTEFNILRSQNNLPKELSYFIARSKNFLDYAISNMNGSSGRQRVNGKILEEYNIVISPENIYKKFGKVSNSIMNQIENNRKEIEKLIELRDYLLPRLMSGEISV